MSDDDFSGEFFDDGGGPGGDNGGGGVGGGAMAAGIGWAIHGHVTDRQTRQLKDAFDNHQHTTTVIEEPKPELINAAEHKLAGPQQWDHFVGQERVKEQLRIHIDSAKKRSKALDHTLLASGVPGVGKTTLAHLIAKEMGGYLMKLVPPFHKDTLFEAAEMLDDGDILFIDEIHKMADGGPRMAENLLHMLEERRLYTDDGPIELREITVIGATTDSGKLPEPVLDRFVIKPTFEPYTVWDLSLITSQFAGRYLADIDDDVIVAIAAGCRGTPRVARELVMAGRDLAVSYDRSPTPEELFEFKQMDPDGMTMTHKKYLITLFRNFGRKNKSTRTVEYVAGADTMRNVLRETSKGLANIERYLLEQGYLDQTPQGRRLTQEGIEKAMHYERLDAR